MNLFRVILNIAARLGRWGAGRSRVEVGLFSLLLVLAIGYVDYITGKDITLSVIYVLPISIAAWFVGSTYAFSLAILSVAIWQYGDIEAGQKITSFLVPVWNGSIRLFFYGFLIVLLSRLNRLQRDLEKRVEERAGALTLEIAERERLERDLLEVSEREQRRMGQDLHDGVCQHLTGTALAGHVLSEKLAAHGLPETSDSRRIVDYVEEAIVLVRGLAKGLHPVQMEADGLMQALDEFAVTTSEMFGVTCRFECDSPVLVRPPAVARHLYRVAQEATGNAIKHGGASVIVISLDAIDSGLKLTIADNGSGIPDPLPKPSGMGMRIMRDRAKVIGASLSIGRSKSGGAELTLLVPMLEAQASESYA